MSDVLIYSGVIVAAIAVLFWASYQDKRVTTRIGGRRPSWRPRHSGKEKAPRELSRTGAPLNAPPACLPISCPTRLRPLDGGGALCGSVRDGSV